MIQAFLKMKDGRYQVVSSDQATELAHWPEDLGARAFSESFEIAWIDLESPTVEELQWLGLRFHFHPLALEDCSHFDQRPKLEIYSDHLFLVIHGIGSGQTLGYRIDEVHCFLTAKALVTVHDGPVDAIRILKAKAQRDRNLLGSDPDFLLHRVLDGIMDANPMNLGELEAEIEVLDEAILNRHRPRQVERIHELQQAVSELRHIIHPQREIFIRLLDEERTEISEKARVYFRDVYDHLLRLSTLLDEMRESLWAIRDAHLAVSAQRTNETMKRLTLFSVVFLPLTFVTGFFGMNFSHIPWESSGLFWIAILVMIAMPAAMIYWIAKKNWI